MPKITITLSDTPDGGIAIHTDFRPAICAPCSPAQSTALDIIQRTRNNWHLKPMLVQELDIDAIHQRHDRVLPAFIEANQS